MTSIRTLSTADDDFDQKLSEVLAWDAASDASVNETVNKIIHSIRADGDEALLALTQRFDGWHPKNMGELEVSPTRLEQAWNNLPLEQQEALQISVQRISRYAERQTMESWSFTEEDGTLLGQKITALDRVGLYVPGGKAAYPSSVLMNAVPAKVAGVPEVIMVVPTPAGELNELVLAAAYISKVDQVFTVGGAQAIAALAYGTQTIPAVDKIVGPGNIYVATAKREVFGQVGIDMIAGPSEILVICDGETNPDWIAMDLFSQAEHDEDAQAILLCPDKAFIDRVQASIDKLMPEMDRKDIIKKALNGRGVLIHCKDMDDACRVANVIAPEHLELSVANPELMAQKIRHAGAIFMGRYTSEALGDYCAGPNHVLPTSKTARFSSPLGVYDFQKRSSLIMVSEQGADTLGRVASVMARGEGLTAHARSAEYRLKD